MLTEISLEKITYYHLIKRTKVRSETIAVAFATVLLILFATLQDG